MPSLSDRLKALGVQLGAENLPQDKAARKVPIESLLEGELAITPHGEVFQVEGRWYPKRMEFKDVLKQGKGTEYIIDSIKFDEDIPALLFTKASLKK